MDEHVAHFDLKYWIGHSDCRSNDKQTEKQTTKHPNQ